jgi:osmotically-inducible protein OsmY
MRIATGAATLPIYLTDLELVDRIRETLASDHVLSDEERQTVSATASGGVVTLIGNVRTKRTRERIQALVDELVEAAEIHIDVVDDIELELAIGHAIEHSGLRLTPGINARSVLGEVTLFGYAPGAGAAEEIVRAVSRVPGVRNVTSRIEAGERAAVVS